MLFKVYKERVFFRKLISSFEETIDMLTSNISILKLQFYES